MRGFTFIYLKREIPMNINNLTNGLGGSTKPRDADSAEN
jgi:hypothetical protein